MFPAAAPVHRFLVDLPVEMAPVRQAKAKLVQETVPVVDPSIHAVATLVCLIQMATIPLQIVMVPVLVRAQTASVRRAEIAMVVLFVR